MLNNNNIFSEYYYKNKEIIENTYINNDSIKRGYKIPNIIHYTFATSILPVEICNIIEFNKKMCSGCLFRFYNDNDCNNIIKTYNTFRSH